MTAKKASTAAAKTKDAAKKTESKKTSAAKKTAASAPVGKVYVQFAGKEIVTDGLVETVKEIWKDAGHRVSSIKSLDIYVKPEESAAYYVINGTETGRVEL